MQQKENNLARNILAIGGLILVLVIPYVYAQNPHGGIAEALLLLYFIPAFFVYSNIDERKFILAVLFVAVMAETINVGFGLYSYAGTSTVPAWVLIGWACTAWALLTLNKILKPNTDRNVTLAAIIAIFGLYALFVSHSVSGFFINSIIMAAVFFATKPRSCNIFLIAVMFGMAIEFSGVLVFNAWHYIDGPDLSKLGAMYSFMYFIASMIAKYEL